MSQWPTARLAALDLIGARERILVEGRFAEDRLFVEALAALRPNNAVFVSHAHNGVPYGALRLLAHLNGGDQAGGAVARTWLAQHAGDGRLGRRDCADEDEGAQ